MCQDGFVYNLEVDNGNTYFANGILVHNCHHALSKSWLSVLNYFELAFVLGVTATPHRGDKRSLGAFFDAVVETVTLFDLIKLGFLSRIRIKTIPLKIEVLTKGAIVTDTEAASALDPILGSVADKVLQHAAKLKTLHFLPLVVTAQKFTGMLVERGINAKCVWGEDPERREKLEWFSRTPGAHLSCASLLLEGYDEPSIECVNVLRPTTSQPLYAQAVGRGTRIHPGKEFLLLLDFLWLHAKHKLVRPAHLVATSDAIADLMIGAAEEDCAERAISLGDPDGSLDLEEVHADAIKQREEKLRRELEAKAKRAERTVDVMEYALDTKDTSMADFEPETPRDAEPPSERQKVLIKTFGIDPASVTCAGHARAVIGKFLYRRKLGLASPKQLLHLRRMGHPSPHEATSAEASDWLDKRWGKKKAA